MFPTLRPTIARAAPRLARTYSAVKPRESIPPVPGLAPDPSPVSSTNNLPPNVPVPEGYDKHLVETVEEGEKVRHMQAPNRATTWSKSQRAREVAMVGPRFEQTIMHMQPRPYAAIELIHKEKVRFVDERIAVCDGGGGPLGHPKIYINVDKPEIHPCGYCGLPFAYSHHKKTLQAQKETDYPLE